MNPQALRRDFVFSGHFRKILSTLTRNGRDSARLWDTEDDSPFSSLGNIAGDYENFSKTQARTAVSGTTRAEMSTRPARIT
jgi:hypothetical protein